MAKRQPVINNKKDYSLQIILTFIMVFIFVAGLSAVNRSINTVSTMFTLFTVLKTLAVSGLVLFALSVLLYFYGRRRENDKMRTLSVVGMVFFSFLAVSCGAISIYGGLAIKLLYVILPAIAVLYLLYIIYQRDCFVIMLISACGSFAMWLFTVLYKMYDYNSYGFTADDLMGLRIFLVITSLALLLIGAVTVFLLQKNKGRVKIGCFVFRFFESSANYTLIYITLALVAVSILLAMFLGATVALYAMFVLFGYLFIIAVYYTVRLM